MKTFQKSIGKPALFVLMMVFALTTSAKSNIRTTMGADTIPADNRVYSQVEKQPEFPGGIGMFTNFLAKNIHYPAVDREAKVTGRVIVSFVVERDGNLTDIKAIRGPSQTEMAEAVRVLKLSPKWKPGIQNKRPVRVAYVVPINFSLERNDVQPIAKTPGSTVHLIRTASAVRVLPNGDMVYSQVDQQPQFPGGMEAFGKFLGQNVRYPAAMREKMLEGKVIAQFIVEPDGSLSNINVLRSPGYGSSEEAERVLKLSPKWHPGLNNGTAVRVEFTIPINFTLKKADPPVTHGAINDKTDGTRLGKAVEIRSPTPIGEEPLFVIDGIARDKDSYGKLDPNLIESISILKDASAEAYGPNGKNGVVVITTRGAKKTGAIDLKGVTGNSPLFVIDGVTRDKNSFDQLDPNLIESVSILKDVSAKVYGEDAKNGVILITTKSAKKADAKK